MPDFCEARRSLPTSRLVGTDLEQPEEKLGRDAD
jgi:hypothetical protein